MLPSSKELITDGKKECVSKANSKPAMPPAITSWSGTKPVVKSVTATASAKLKNTKYFKPHKVKPK